MLTNRAVTRLAGLSSCVLALNIQAQMPIPVGDDFQVKDIVQSKKLIQRYNHRRA